MKGDFLTKVEGVRGGETVKEGGLSTICLDGKFYSDNYIRVKGKKHDSVNNKLVDVEQVIRIDRDGKTVFIGTFDQLCMKLMR